MLVLTYDDAVERALGKIEGLLRGTYPLPGRAVGLFLLQEDPEITRLVRERDGERFAAIEAVVEEARAGRGEPLSYAIPLQRQRRARALAELAVTRTGPDRARRWADRLSDLTIDPVTGIPLLLLVTYFGLYKFVGGFGAGTLVDALDRLYRTYVNPWVNAVVATYVPWPAVQSLLARDYGVITLGLRYAVVIILPIVGTFFVAFSVIEDTGYLPRLAMLVDVLFKRIGLNGRAVIPMTLGFGCDTMATVVTRTLETRRERVIATFLMALAIPCSAQLGVILGLLSGNPGALVVWGGFVALLFAVIGYLTARILPGERPSFYMELPPLRLPRPGNILIKTYSRVERYVAEVVPLFVLASVALWLGDLTGLFDRLVVGLRPLVGLLGLPDQAAGAFIFGFFRRDYGAAGLYDLERAGALTGRQLVVSAVTLTLFVPCVAQFTVMARERGTKTAFAMAGIIALIAFASGWFLNVLLTGLGVVL